MLAAVAVSSEHPEEKSELEAELVGCMLDGEGGSVGIA